MDTLRSSPVHPEFNGEAAIIDASASVLRAAVAVWLGALLAGHLGTVVAREAGADALGGFVHAFDAEREQSVPTWTNALLLASVGVTLLGLSVLEGSRDRVRWLLAAIGAIAFSIEEIADAHAYWSSRLSDAFDTSGALTYAWVVPGLALCVFVGVLNVGFVRRMDRQLRRGVVVAAGAYVAAAIGMEMAMAGIAPDTAMVAGILSGLEEFGEMTGVAVLWFSVVAYMKRRHGSVTIRLS